MSEVLFICTGNFYRSRFAEAVFNHQALRARLPWRAFSRGLAIELAPPGEAIAPVVAEALQRRGIALAGTAGRPQTLVQADLKRADRIIAIKESEHRPVIEGRFPGWESRIEYWHVSDIDQTAAGEAMDVIESRVRTLVSQLAGAAPPAPARRG